MAMFKLRESSFTPIPEGETKFKITEVDDSKLEDFGKIEVKCVTNTGKKHSERFVVNTDGGANAFSYFVKVVLDDWNIEEIDPQKLVGKYFEARVEHDVQPNKNDKTKTVTFVRLQDKKPCESWENEAIAPAKTVEPAKADLSVDDILGL